MDRREIYGNGKINARVKEEKLLENIDISSKNRELIRNFISYLAFYWIWRIKNNQIIFTIEKNSINNK